MTNGSAIRQALLACAACFLLAACEAGRDPCLQPQNVAVQLHFYQKAADTGSTFRDTLLPNMLLNPLDNPAVYTVNGVKNVAAYTIRLSPLDDVCRWYLQPDSARPDRRDTITFAYQRKLHFISNACGYTYYFNLSDVRPSGRVLGDTIHSIDSIVIADREVNGDAGKEHLKIYFHNGNR